MTAEPTNHDQSIDHLDFAPRCNVGHKGGASRNIATGKVYSPCENAAVFVSKVHGHDKNDKPIDDFYHFWCVDHLTEFTMGFQKWLDSTKSPGCERCQMKLTGIGDLIFDLKTLE